MNLSDLIHPKSIVVVGASNDVSKPGGKVLRNILDNSFAGTVYGINPKEKSVQGIPCFASAGELPASVDLPFSPSGALVDPIRGRIDPESLLPRIHRAFRRIQGNRPRRRGAAGTSAGSGAKRQCRDDWPQLHGRSHNDVLRNVCRPIPKLAPDGVEFASGSAPRPRSSWKPA